MAIRNSENITFYEFEKTPVLTTVNVVSIIILAIIAPLFITFIAIGISGTTGIEGLFVYLLPILLLAYYVPLIVISIKSACKLKGVFLFDDYLEISTSMFYFTYSNSKFKNVKYTDILYINYVGSFHKDKNAKTSYGYLYIDNLISPNFAGGKTKNCLKIKLKDDRCCFFSVDDNTELMREIRQRMVDNGNENGYLTGLDFEK